MHKILLYSFTLLLFASLALSSCQSTPQIVDQEWTVDQFFKSAQEAIDAGELETALYYYEVFLVRYPENHSKGIAAEYERAMLHKKLKQEELAILEFKAILEKYETSTFVILYPSRYKILSEKVLAGLIGEALPEADMDKYPVREKPARAQGSSPR
ncbi:MAG: hypothetical protein B6241_02430 [Spirochaetaceae bacterium 4572_59]|nr:MAG: hypothetical protein B6241_02430 [Spirochaetaceae bacterium 4572_59]